MNRLRGVRDLILDLAIVGCLCGVAFAIVYEHAPLEVLVTLGAVYTGIAAKRYAGKKQQGIQAVEEIKARNGGG